MLDGATPADIYYFCMAAYESTAVTWRGKLYTPIDVMAEGFDVVGQGSMPRPRIMIGNACMAMASAVIAFNDLVGAQLTRWRTFRKYLDGQSAADPNIHFPKDIYVIERKTSQTKLAIEWELSGALDREGLKIPRRMVLRDACTHRYRYWTGSAFDYSRATCPYSAARYYDEVGNVVTAPEDRCGKRLSDCKLRFPGKQILPTTAFPGAAKTRV